MSHRDGFRLAGRDAVILDRSVATSYPDPSAPVSHVMSRTRGSKGMPPPRRRTKMPRSARSTSRQGA